MIYVMNLDLVLLHIHHGLDQIWPFDNQNNMLPFLLILDGDSDDNDSDDNDRLMMMIRSNGISNVKIKAKSIVCYE